VFGLVAKGTGHATVAGIQRVSLIARSSKDSDRVVVFLRGLLVAVAVIGEVFIDISAREVPD
jgi:hypothetical protein